MKNSNNSFTIGNIKMDGKLVLGPMAGITDISYREICKEYGAALIYSEMVSIKGIFYDNKNTTQLLKISPNEHPIALQLFGSDPLLMGEIAKKIEELPFDILDINMGCPVPKVVNNNEGSALMKDPLLVGRIVESVVKSIKKPVTIKIRKGFDLHNINADEIAYIAQENGASAVAVHGRTRTEYYSGKADWDIIRKVKEKVRIPVIGNGDVKDGPSAKEMLEYTNCDGVMIGRAARGNPWIFSEVNAFLEGRDYEKPSIKEIYDMLIRHAKALILDQGEVLAIKQMRKHTAWYTQGLKDSALLRFKVNQVDTFEQFNELLETMLLNENIRTV